MLAVEDREVRAPGTDLLRIPLCHDASDLGDVVEVVNGPCRQKLSQIDRTELGVTTRQCQLSLGKPPVPDDLEIGLATLRELVEEMVQRPAGEASELGE